jgi:protein archease
MADDQFFTEFDHTGDLGIVVTAPSRTELFARAATALSRLLVEEGNVGASGRRTLEVCAADDAELMHDLLAGALNLFLIDGFIWRDVSVEERDAALLATFAGERFEPDRHRLIQEIKAVTYHRLEVGQSSGGGWSATVIFDI